MMVVDFSSLYKSLGYVFTNTKHLKLALTHASVSGVRNNERLEFLGDGVLGLAIGELLFKKFPETNEGQLSRVRAHLVQKKTLAAVARDLNLSDYLVLGPGELRSGGYQRDSILADALEAIIGAIFLESDYKRVSEIIGVWFASRLKSVDINRGNKDPKSCLQEWLQAKQVSIPKYIVKDILGKDHNQTFVVKCSLEELNMSYSAKGKTRKEAEQKAAEYILNQLLMQDPVN